ncbi:MAG: triose-phosphate isomerase [Candidatus Diapherotrites archaeon]|nr:triose-phosphate isomerase [Candidatus Diapherotrites archaeon]
MDSWLFVNFKVYESAFGKGAVKLAKSCEAVAQKTGVNVVAVVSPVDVRLVAASVSIPVFSQHCDLVSFGKGNGKILPEALREAGAAGVVVNHAEDPVPDETVSRVIARCREAKLQVLACAENDARAKSIAGFSPDFLAVEPPELIGGDVSVSTADPALVSRSVKTISSVSQKIVPIMGAGVKSQADAQAAVRLGCRGLFVASGVVLAMDPKSAMMGLANGLASIRE